MLIKSKNRFMELSKELQDVALLREKNPEASLEKIGEMLEQRLSKAGVSHRFKRIKQIADEYKDLIPKELYEALYKYEVEIND